MQGKEGVSRYDMLTLYQYQSFQIPSHSHKLCDLWGLSEWRPTEFSQECALCASEGIRAQKCLPFILRGARHITHPFIIHHPPTTDHRRTTNQTTSSHVDPRWPKMESLAWSLLHRICAKNQQKIASNRDGKTQTPKTGGRGRWTGKLWKKMAIVQREGFGTSTSCSQWCEGERGQISNK